MHHPLRIFGVDDAACFPDNRAEQLLPRPKEGVVTERAATFDPVYLLLRAVADHLPVHSLPLC